MNTTKHEEGEEDGQSKQTDRCSATVPLNAHTRKNLIKEP